MSGAAQDDRRPTGMRICIDVPDVERAVAFYGAAFGWTALRRTGFAELQGAPVPIDLLEKKAETRPAPGAVATRTYERHWTPLHLDVLVADIDASVSRAVEAGAVVESPAVQRPFGKIAMLADPFGHGFCLIELAGRGYDEE